MWAVVTEIHLCQRQFLSRNIIPTPPSPHRPLPGSCAVVRVGALTSTTDHRWSTVGLSPMAGGGVSLAAGGGSGAAATDVAGGGGGGIIAEAWLVSAAAAAARDWARHPPRKITEM
eukprot:COSAG01_NODE_1888_length_8979_cov_78.343806_8_plen_116_part_00